MTTQKRPKPWAETRPNGTRCVWRFDGQKYRTSFYDDPEEARADASAQITEQMKGTWRDRSGPKILLEEWIDIWVAMLDDIEPTTRGKYKYLVEAHILPEFEGRPIGSLTFEEIEKWEKTIPTRISARGRPYARSVAAGARSLLITILGDAVHADRLDRNPAGRRKGRRGKVRVKGRTPTIAQDHSPANVLTPLQAICLAERTALLSGNDIDFVMNITAAWTGVRWGELLAFEGSEGNNSPLQIRDNGISTYALDWQLRELGGAVTKSPPKDGSYRVLDIPPFLADLLRWARDNRRATCSCPLINDHPACKGNDPTPPNYLFLGPKGGHPRRSNYADRYITPAAEGLYPARNGTRRPVYVLAEPWPGIPIIKGNKKVRAADLAEATWPNLTGKFHPHDNRHTHATWLDATDIPKVLQMDRRGHAMPGMDAIYNHITVTMREHLCDVLQSLWMEGLKRRRQISPRSAVATVGQLLAENRYPTGLPQTLSYNQREHRLTYDPAIRRLPTRISAFLRKKS
jgi:integrase